MGGGSQNALLKRLQLRGRLGRMVTRQRQWQGDDHVCPLLGLWSALGMPRLLQPWEQILLLTPMLKGIQSWITFFKVPGTWLLCCHRRILNHGPKRRNSSFASRYGVMATGYYGFLVDGAWCWKGHNHQWMYFYIPGRSTIISCIPLGAMLPRISLWDRHRLPCSHLHRGQSYQHSLEMQGQLTVIACCKY